MRKAEFISKIGIWETRQKRNKRILMGCFFGALAMWLVFMNWLDHSAPSSPSRIALSCFPIFLLAALWVAQFFSIRRIYKRYGMKCPACGKGLGGVAPIVIATGNCGMCGQRILDENEGHAAMPDRG